MTKMWANGDMKDKFGLANAETLTKITISICTNLPTIIMEER